MKLSYAIRKRIKFYLKEKNMNVWKWCKMSGIPCSTISTFMSGKTELIKLDTLLHIWYSKKRLIKIRYYLIIIFITIPV